MVLEGNQAKILTLIKMNITVNLALVGLWLNTIFYQNTTARIVYY